MGKYQPLYARLSKAGDCPWMASFDELERILGFPLPASARRHAAWWANQAGRGHVQSSAWREAGWMTRNLDLVSECVEFAPIRNLDASPKAASASLFEQASRYSGIENRDALINAALGALIEREAAARLAQLGGTMPDYAAPPRDRRA